MNQKQNLKKNFKIKGMVFRGESYLSPKNSMTSLSPQPSNSSLRFTDNLRKSNLPMLSPKSHRSQINKCITMRSTRFHSEFKKVTSEHVIQNIELKFLAFRQYHFVFPELDDKGCDKIHCSHQIRQHTDRQLFIICEGHGKYGKECSRFVCQGLTEKLWKINNEAHIFPQDKQSISQQFGEVYYEVNKEIQIQKDFEVTQSGSTALSLLIFKQSVYCSNLGESKALFFYKDPIKLIFKQLNPLHSLSKVSEQQRILQNGGKIEQESIDYVRQGPLKIWLKHNKQQGMLLPRCIGYSQWRQIGVTCEPETSNHIFTTPGYVVMGNSQLFELIDTIDIGKIISQYFPPDSQQSVNTVCEQLLSLAKSRNQSVLNIEKIVVMVMFMGN